MTSTTAAQVAGRAGDNPAGPVALSPAVEAAQAALLARRAALGIASKSAAGLDQLDQVTTGPTAAERAQADLTAQRVERGINYRRPGAVDSRAWLARLPGLDQLDAPAAIVDPFTGAGGLPIDATDQLDQGGALAGVMATVYPSLAAAVQSSKVATVCRLWFLIRAWDDRGRGLYDLDAVYEAFSGDGSPWRVVGRRQLQILIKQGAGIFWTLRNRRGGRFTALQMTGPVGVARALGVGHLAGSPVGVPVADLLGGMHRANAALFSAVLTLRTDDHGGRPTSRRTLAGMTGAAASTQRTYIKTAGVEARPNYVTLPSGDIDQPGVFVYRGRVAGRPGRAILARRLPNSHDPQLTARPRGRVKKINRILNLVTNGARGERLKIERIYHDTAAAAWSAWGRAYNHDHYWPGGRTAAGSGLWGMVEAVTR
jgi:hypothetical protein